MGHDNFLVFVFISKGYNIWNDFLLTALIQLNGISGVRGRDGVREKESERYHGFASICERMGYLLK